MGMDRAKLEKSRFSSWVALMGCSALASGSMLDAAMNLGQALSLIDIGALVCCIITFTTSFLIFILLMLSTKYSDIFHGSIIEGVTVFFLLILWCGGIGIITSTNRDLAVNCEGTILDANLYYFSWASFILCFVIFMTYLRSVHVFDPGEIGKISILNHDRRILYWGGSLISNIVVCASIADLLQSSCNSIMKDGLFNQQALLGMVISICGTGVCFYVLFRKFKKQNNRMSTLEFSGSVCLSMMFLVGAVLLTGEHEPGSNIGNLYYSVWSSFFFSTILLKETYIEFRSQSTGSVFSCFSSVNGSRETHNSRLGDSTSNINSHERT